MPWPRHGPPPPPLPAPPSPPPARCSATEPTPFLLCSCFSCGPPPLQVVKYPDPVLPARNKRINTFHDNLRALTDEIFDVMYK
jgi:hypothetical protein